MAINQITPQIDVNEFGGMGTRSPLPIVVTAKRAKSKRKSKPKSKQADAPVSVSYDGGRTWISPGQENMPLESIDGGQTWTPVGGEQEAIAPGYDTGRGLEIMDAITQTYPGIDPNVAAGVAGNFLYESYGLPNIYEGQTPYNAGSYLAPGGGFGIAQWTGPRRRALEAMPNANTLPTQMQYFAQENAGPERRAWEATMAAPTLEDATTTFATKWERPGVPALDKRIAFANQIRNAYDERRLADMQRQADILSEPTQLIGAPISRQFDYNMVVPTERIPVDLTEQMPYIPAQPVMYDQPSEYPAAQNSMIDYLGISPEVMPLPYRRTPEYQMELERRLMNR